MRYLVSRAASFIPRGSAVLAATTLGSYVMGLLRDRIFAQQFGASTSLDSYNAAFLVPDFAFNLLVASGIAAAVVPLFTQLRVRDRAEAQAYVNSIMTMAVGVMLLCGVGIFLAAPWLASVIAPGLSEAAQVLVARLMRIIAFSPILFAASNALGALLVAEQRFLAYGLSPIFYNAGIIAGALVLAPRFGVMGVAWGTLLGAGAHLASRVIGAVRSGWTLRPPLQLPIPEFRTTVRLMVPKMIGHPVELITFGVFTSLASLLSAGSITVLNFARNFQSVPVGVIGIAMATAVFPSLAQAALTSRMAVRALLRRSVIGVMAASSAAAVLLFVVRRPLIAMLLGGGAFDAAAVERTALVLGVFCLAIPTESLSHLLARAFYATKNTSIPVCFSIVSLVVAGGSAYLFSLRMGLVGLPLGFFLGSLAKATGLLTVFYYRWRD